MEKVSILIPCYNDGAYLGETIASIERQTWRNIEIIIVDDASDDARTVQLLRELEAAGKVRLFRQERKGPPAARNRAFLQSTGEYVLPLDADDCIEPTYVEEAVELLRRNPKAGVCYCRADFFGERSGPWELPDYALDRMLVDNVVFVSAVMRREVMEQAGGYDESFRTGMEDYDFYLTVIENGWEILQIPKVYFHYRAKKTSHSRRLVSDGRDYYGVYEKLYDKHRKLFLAHADALIPNLREAYLRAQQDAATLRRQLVLAKEPVWKKLARRVRDGLMRG